MKSFKCQSCGSSSIHVINDGLAECEHCGASLILNQLSAAESGDKNRRKNMIGLIIFTTALLLFAVVWRMMGDDLSPVEANKTPASARQNQPSQKTHKKSDLSALKPVADIKKPDIEPSSSTNTEVKSQENVKPQIKILHQVSGTTLSGGIYWIFSIVNDGVVTASRANVVVSLLDDNNQRLEEQAGWSKREMLAAGEESVVLVYIAQPPQVNYRSEITAQARPHKGSFLVSEVMLEVKDYVVKQKSQNRYDVIGDVFNPHEGQADFVKVVAVALNANDQTVGIADGFVTTTNIDAGQQSGFKVSAGAFLTETPVSWSVWAKGRLRQK